MELLDMDGCCKAAVLCEFGGGEEGHPGTFEEVFTEDYNCPWEYQTLAEAKEEWQQECLSIFIQLKAYKRSGEKLIIYANTTHQPWARTFLRKLGFHKLKRQQTSGGRPLDGWYLLMSEFKPDEVKL